MSLQKMIAEETKGHKYVQLGRIQKWGEKMINCLQVSRG